MNSKPRAATGCMSKTQESIERSRAAFGVIRARRYSDPITIGMLLDGRARCRDVPSVIKGRRRGTRSKLAEITVRPERPIHLGESRCQNRFKLCVAESHRSKYRFAYLHAFRREVREA